MSDADKAVRYNRLAHAVRCYLAAQNRPDVNVDTALHWHRQIMKVLGGDDDE